MFHWIPSVSLPLDVPSTFHALWGIPALICPHSDLNTSRPASTDVLLLNKWANLELLLAGLLWVASSPIIIYISNKISKLINLTRLWQQYPLKPQQNTAKCGACASFLQSTLFVAFCNITIRRWLYDIRVYVINDSIKGGIIPVVITSTNAITF